MHRIYTNLTKIQTKPTTDSQQSNEIFIRIDGVEVSESEAYIEQINLLFSSAHWRANRTTKKRTREMISVPEKNFVCSCRLREYESMHLEPKCSAVKFVFVQHEHNIVDHPRVKHNRIVYFVVSTFRFFVDSQRVVRCTIQYFVLFDAY